MTATRAGRERRDAGVVKAGAALHHAADLIAGLEGHGGLSFAVERGDLVEGVIYHARRAVVLEELTVEPQRVLPCLTAETGLAVLMYSPPKLCRKTLKV